MATLDVEPTELAPYAQAKDSGQHALAPSYGHWAFGHMAPGSGSRGIRLSSANWQRGVAPVLRGGSLTFPRMSRNGLRQEVHSGLWLLSLGKMH